MMYLIHMIIWIAAIYQASYLLEEGKKYMFGNPIKVNDHASACTTLGWFLYFFIFLDMAYETMAIFNIKIC